MTDKENPKRRQFIQPARVLPFKNSTVVNIFLALWTKTFKINTFRISVT